jgi:hypothetical protein
MSQYYGEDYEVEGDPEDDHDDQGEVRRVSRSVIVAAYYDVSCPVLVPCACVLQSSLGGVLRALRCTESTAIVVQSVHYQLPPPSSRGRALTESTWCSCWMQALRHSLKLSLRRYANGLSLQGIQGLLLVDTGLLVDGCWVGLHFAPLEIGRAPGRLLLRRVP